MLQRSELRRITDEASDVSIVVDPHFVARSVTRKVLDRLRVQVGGISAKLMKCFELLDAVLKRWHDLLACRIASGMDCSGLACYLNQRIS